MNSWQIVRLFAGTLVFVSLALGVSGSPLSVSGCRLALKVCASEPTCAPLSDRVTR